MKYSFVKNGYIFKKVGLFNKGVREAKQTKERGWPRRC
jgi:hypothetical protein